MDSPTQSRNHVKIPNSFRIYIGITQMSPDPQQFGQTKQQFKKHVAVIETRLLLSLY